MDPISAAIASVGLSSARAFLPAFIAAVLLRVFGEHEVARDAATSFLGFQQVAAWFTSDWAITILGVLAVLEILAQHNEYARAIMFEVDQYAKPVMGFLLSLGLISATDAATVDQIRGVDEQEASLGAALLSTAAGVGTYIVASARGRLYGLLLEIDPDNSTGVHRVLSWGEDLYAGLGAALLLVVPLLAALLCGIVIAAVLLLERRARAREERAKGPCSGCGQPMYRSAPACPSCLLANPSPRAIGLFGATSAKAADPRTHDLQLLAKRRCPTCATRLPGRDPNAACPACQRTPLRDGGLVLRYDAYVSARLMPTLVTTGLLGLIPVAGLVAGVLIYRLALVSPYRVHVPGLRSMLMRWLIRLAVLGLVLLHLMPVIGAVSAMLLAAMNYTVWRGAFLAGVRGAAGSPGSPETGAAEGGEVGLGITPRRAEGGL